MTFAMYRNGLKSTPFQLTVLLQVRQTLFQGHVTIGQEAGGSKGRVCISGRAALVMKPFGCLSIWHP